MAKEEQKEKNLEEKEEENITEIEEVDKETDSENNEIEKLKNELEKKESELEELKSSHIRLQADFENFKKISEKQKLETIQYANEKLIEKLLDCYEDFTRVLENQTEEEDLKEAVELIYKKMKKVLEDEGLEEIPTEGEKFDINKHEALMTKDDEDYEDGDIIQEIMKGYTLKDKILKYSKVVVCKK